MHLSTLGGGVHTMKNIVKSQDWEKDNRKLNILLVTRFYFFSPKGLKTKNCMLRLPSHYDRTSC